VTGIWPPRQALRVLPAGPGRTLQAAQRYALAVNWPCSARRGSVTALSPVAVGQWAPAQ
jgi:hypothetical protein